MKNVNKILAKTTGLSEKEIEIYLTLLELGEGTVIDIAKKSGIKRTTVYNMLPSMVESGLVSVTSKNKRKLFFVEDVRILKNVLEDKQIALDRVLPELQTIHNITPFKPKIVFYEGTGGFKEMIYDLFKTSKAGDEVLSFIGSKKFYEILPDNFAEPYWKERIKRKISTRVLSPRFKASEDMVKTATEQLRKIKLIDDPDFSFQAGIEIYGNKIALMSYRENYMGVIIESKEINRRLSKCHAVQFKLI